MTISGTKIAATLEPTSAVARAKLISQKLPWKSFGHSHLSSPAPVSRHIPPFSHRHICGNGRARSDAKNKTFRYNFEVT